MTANPSFAMRASTLKLLVTESCPTVEVIVTLLVAVLDPVS